jgi:hypothetical protein
VRFDRHHPGWLALVRGQKQWLLADSTSPMPPHPNCEAHIHCDECMGSVFHADARALHCVQDEGDVIYFPADWWHATCNVSPLTVGVGGQQYFDWPNPSDAMLAAARGDADGLRAALRTDSANLEAPGKSGRAWLLAHDKSSVVNGPEKKRGWLTQPLHLAAAHGALEMVNLLIDAGAKIHAVNADRDTALCLAARAGSLEIVETLLTRGANAEDCRRGLAPLLHNAARSGNLALVRSLVERWAQSPAQRCVSLACKGKAPGHPRLTSWRGVALASDVALLWQHADVLQYLRGKEPEEAGGADELTEDDDDMPESSLFPKLWASRRAREAVEL